MNAMPEKCVRRPYLVDTTLRDGEQTPGVVFSAGDKCRIAERLADLGVTEIEAGTPVMGRREVEALRDVARLGLSCRLSVWCRARREDLDAAARTGIGSVHISLPTSPIHLAASGKSPGWVLDCLETIVVEACRRFDFVSVGAQDASRTSPEFLSDCIRRAAEVGARRFRLADTVGCWNPFQVHSIIQRFAEAFPGIEIAFHGHNDLGMATANTLAAFQAGAAAADVTVGGLGERAGNAPLEEVAMALKLTAGLDLGLDTSRLYALCSYVAERTQRPIPVNKPIVGEGVFRHESGIHVDGLLRDRATYEPFPAEDVGQPAARITLGKHSGASAVRHVLKQSGILIDRDEARRLVPAVREDAETSGHVAASRLVSLYRGHRVLEHY